MKLSKKCSKFTHDIRDFWRCSLKYFFVKYLFRCEWLLRLIAYLYSWNNVNFRNTLKSTFYDNYTLPFFIQNQNNFSSVLWQSGWSCWVLPHKKTLQSINPFVMSRSPICHAICLKYWCQIFLPTRRSNITLALQPLI